MQNPNKWLFNVSYNQIYHAVQYFYVFREGANLSFGITKKYKSWTFRADVSDVLRTSIQNLNSQVPDRYHALASQYYDLRAVNVTLSYTFGNRNLRTQEANDSGNENAKRIN